MKAYGALENLFNIFTFNTIKYTYLFVWIDAPNILRHKASGKRVTIYVVYSIHTHTHTLKQLLWVFEKVYESLYAYLYNVYTYTKLAGRVLVFKVKLCYSPSSESGRSVRSFDVCRRRRVCICVCATLRPHRTHKDVMYNVYMYMVYIII